MAAAKPLIRDRWAGLAQSPIAFYVIGLNWSAQVNFVQEALKKPTHQNRCTRQFELLARVRKWWCPCLEVGRELLGAALKLGSTFLVSWMNFLGFRLFFQYPPGFVEK